MKNGSILWKRYYLEKTKTKPKQNNKTLGGKPHWRKPNNCKPADIYVEKQELLPSLSIRGNDTVQKSASKVDRSVNEETQSTSKCDKTLKTSHASFHPATTALLHNYSN